MYALQIGQKISPVYASGMKADTTLFLGHSPPNDGTPHMGSLSA
jgi:hypothetical protein